MTTRRLTITRITAHAPDTQFTKRVVMTERLRREVEIDRMPDKAQRKRELSRER